MVSFAVAAKEADATGLPVVEGFAVQLKEDAAPATVSAAVTAALDARLPGYGWTPAEMPGRWQAYRPAGAATAPGPPPLGAAWEAVRELKKVPGIASAEPLLLTRLPVTNGSDARRQFRLWGTISDARLARIQAGSDKDHKHWSLVQMGVCDEKGEKGAWAIWKAKHPGGMPGEGILVAHPDTGYTGHARLLPYLATRPSDPPGHSGRNFVERELPDALTNGLDPMQDRTLGNFPGHGTSTASVIAARNDPAGVPWGVAPGRRSSRCGSLPRLST
jgi:hypothetical protein